MFDIKQNCLIKKHDNFESNKIILNLILINWDHTKMNGQMTVGPRCEVIKIVVFVKAFMRGAVCHKIAVHEKKSLLNGTLLSKNAQEMR